MRRIKQLAEQVVVVTGATSGIGVATVMAAAAAGARVVMVARGEADLAIIQARIRNRGGQATDVGHVAV